MKFSSETPWEDNPGESVQNEATWVSTCPPRHGRLANTLLLALGCSAVVIGGAYLWINRVDENDLNKRLVAAELVDRSSHVRPTPERQSLKNGDFVVIRPNALTVPKVQQVAAKPNETVIIRRSGALEGLYMLGESSGYVVVSDREPTRIIRAEDVSGTLVSTQPKPAE